MIGEWYSIKRFVGGGHGGFAAFFNAGVHTVMMMMLIMIHRVMMMVIMMHRVVIMMDIILYDDDKLNPLGFLDDFSWWW